MNQLISVIIPTHNRSNTISATLDSLFSQSYNNIEIIVVDDGSTDQTENVLSKYESRIKIVKQKNAGSNAARNRGFKDSTGEYILFSDDDICWESNAIETMLNALMYDNGASFAYCRFKLGWKKFKLREFNSGTLKKINYIHTSSLMRRADFPGFDESLQRFQDWDLWLTLLENGKRGVFVKKVLFKIRTDNPITKSTWLPSYAYRLPWKIINWKPKSIASYEKAKAIVQKKHGIM
ncbi:MAG: hypothetical protein ACD_76C00106G0009 [uncultured bacterium]|nr:MAG: hypothetical protein ACD_76C00106G0009 [uncultured bacterium]